MKQFYSFVIKEAKHIVRDKRTMLILFGMPLVLMLLFGFAIRTDVRNVRTVVVMANADYTTQQAVERLAQSEYFTIVRTAATPQEAERIIRNQKADMAVVFTPYPTPSKGENDPLHNHSIQLIVDGADPNMAQQWSNYATQVLMNPEGGVVNAKLLYNPQMKSAYNFVPGIMGMLLMLVCAMMTSISIVREKERGTMEVLLVSPAKPLMVIIAKAVPYLVLAFAILTAAGLSFIGLGIEPPTPEWGSMLSNARSYIRDYSYMCLFPGLAIAITIFSLNVLGDGLRDALDPKLRQ